jgi:hypothetical protein
MLAPGRMSRRWIEIAVVAALLVCGAWLRFAIARDYVFAGSDSYGYLKLADEWRTHGRYALSPAGPLYFARTPLYPAFLMLVKGAARAEMSGGEGWGKIVRAQALLDLVVTGLLVWWMARRLAGRAAGAIALGLAMLVPFSLIPVGAVLTECVAMALTTAAVAPLVLLRAGVLKQDSPQGERSFGRPRLAFSLSGAAIGLCTLLRPDGLLAVLAIPPALLALDGNRQRLACAGLALTAFLLTFAPWPIRNQVRFGRPWAFGTRVDRRQEPILHWQGAHHFMQSYGRDWHAFNEGTKCMFERGCSLGELLSEGAVDTPDGRARLIELLARQRREGLTPAVDSEYEALARDNFRRHPIRDTIVYPAWRALLMWGDSYDEIFQKPPLPSLYNATEKLLPAIMILLVLGLAAGAAGMLLEPRLRPDAWILLGAIVGRTAVLAYTFYPMTRYIREVMPIGYVVTGCGLVALGSFARRRIA